LDVDTGGGEIIATVPRLPSRMVVTEGWLPNIAHARRLLSPRGVQVVPVEQGCPLQFPDASFELASSRHPVNPDWPEIARLLTDDGTYLAQHVGPESAYELIEWLLGPLPRDRLGRDPEREAAAARSAGLQIVDLRTARCRMEFSTSGPSLRPTQMCLVGSQLHRRPLPGSTRTTRRPHPRTRRVPGALHPNSHRSEAGASLSQHPLLPR
jgi:hypothetical protein